MYVPRFLAVGRKGNAAIEFALVVPLFLLMLVGLVEVGLSTYQSMMVQDAAEAGALYAAKHGWNQAAIQAAVVSSTAVTGMTATPVPTNFCGCPNATGITAITCTSTCTGGTTPGQYVQVHASYIHTPIFVSSCGYASCAPSWMTTTTYTATSTVRIQ